MIPQSVVNGNVIEMPAKWRKKHEKEKEQGNVQDERGDSDVQGQVHTGDRLK